MIEKEPWWSVRIKGDVIEGEDSVTFNNNCTGEPICLPKKKGFLNFLRENKEMDWTLIAFPDSIIKKYGLIKFIDEPE